MVSEEQRQQTRNDIDLLHRDAHQQPVKRTKTKATKEGYSLDKPKRTVTPRAGS